MAKLIYFTPASLDGYIANETGDYDWAAPDEEVFAFINDVMRPLGTYLYGRKMYQTMAVWETPEVIPDRTPLDVSVGGPTLAANAIRTLLVDEYHLLVVPTMLGRGTRVVPNHGRTRLDLLDEHRFANGMVYLGYHAPVAAPGSER